MKASRLERVDQILHYALAAVAALYLLTYLVLAIFRMRYPFELEWMEGGAVDHVRRILAGQKLYVRPSLDFVPYIYTPLYSYLAAGLCRVVGVGFAPLRLISFAASAASFVAIYLLVKRETARAWAGLLAAGSFAACFTIGGAWFDIARVDSLSLFLLLLSLYLVRFSTSWKTDLLAGLLVGLAFLAKQTALLASVPLMLYCLVVNWRRAVAFLAAIAAVVGGSTLLLNGLHEGWYTYYIFILPSQHRILTDVLLSFWLKDLLLPLPLATAVGLFYLISRLKGPGKERFFYPLALAGLVGEAWFSRMHYGGYANVLLPAYAALAILFALGIQRLSELVVGQEKRAVLEMLIHLVAILQLAALVYNPLAQVPTAQDAQAGQEFLQTLRQIPGDVYVPFHGYLPALAGKPTYAHWMAISDVLRGEKGAIQEQLRGEIQQAFREQRFAAIIVDIPGWFQEDLAPYYQQAGPVFATDGFWPVTGPRIRPEFMYVPKGSMPARPPGPGVRAPGDYLMSRLQ